MNYFFLNKHIYQSFQINILSIYTGNKRKPYETNDNQTNEKQERKYGEFTMTFRIPDTYERKWVEYNCENGVLKISYPKDNDDQLNFNENTILEVSNQENNELDNI